MRFDGQECLGYTFDEKSSDVPEQFPINDKALLDWLTTLPMLNINAAGKQLQEYLVMLNRTNIADKQRLILLETMRPTVVNLMDIFIHNYSGRVPGLTQEGLDIFKLVSDLNKSMAEGYTFLLHELAIKKPNLISRKKYVQLIERSLFYLTESLHLTYLMYMPKPTNIWRLIHNTYRYARQFNLHQVVVKDSIVSEKEKVTVDFLYKRIILQSMISPDSLRTAQIDAVYRGLSPWLDEILVVSPDTDKDVDNIYHINYLSDNGPTTQSMKTEEEMESLWLVDNKRLIERIWLWEETGEIESIEGPVNLSNDLLMYLVNILGVRPKFDRDRVEIYGEVSVITGLTNIETVLSGQIASFDLQNNDSDVSQNWGEKTNNDVWDLTQYVTPIETKKIEETNKKQVSEEEDLAQHWQFVNKSTHGLGLLCQLSVDNLLEVGQLLMFKYDPKIAPADETKAQRWLLGTVCWMRSAQTLGGIYAGIRILGDEVRAASLQLEDSPDIALLLNNQATKLKTVLVSRNNATVGDTLEIKYLNNNYNIQLDSVVWQNDGFSQFQYH